MRSVCVDPTARTATVDGGAQARDVDAETAPHGCVWGGWVGGGYLLHGWAGVQVGECPGGRVGGWVGELLGRVKALLQKQRPLRSPDYMPCFPSSMGAPSRSLFLQPNPSPARLAVPLGVCATVGVGGLALNGGLSLLSRAHGAVCDNILAATVVLADGSVVSEGHVLAARSALARGTGSSATLPATQCSPPSSTSASPQPLLSNRARWRLMGPFSLQSQSAASAHAHGRTISSPAVLPTGPRHQGLARPLGVPSPSALCLQALPWGS